MTVAPANTAATAGDHAAMPTFAEALAVWLRIGLLSFGGPAGQIATMHRILVDERKWIDDRGFLSALNFCMLLPGPEATQLVTYVGWRLHGVKGGIAAGLLFVLPGALVMLALAMAYVAFGKLPMAEAIFLGIKAAVLAIVVEALLRVARRALKGTGDWLIAAAAFVAIFAFQVPFPLIVAVAALIGAARGIASEQPAVERLPAAPTVTTARDTAMTIITWAAIWLVPLLALAAVLGPQHILAQLALFFSKLAVVTFGGAYAVLAYMAQDVVQARGWLQPGEMVDALGLAETTPGPLILVTEFVGYVAGHRAGAGSVVVGIAGAVVALWATFAPCYLWIFAGAPYIERMNRIPRLKAALAAITAAVVGVVLNLTVWFALNVLFARQATLQAGPLRLQYPELASADLAALGLAALAFVLLFALHRGIATTLAICAACAVGLRTLAVA